MEQQKIDRINELAHLAKQRELSQTEISEREILRKEYIAEWKGNTQATLDNTYIMEPDGTKHKIGERKTSKAAEKPYQ